MSFFGLQTVLAPDNKPSVYDFENDQLGDTLDEAFDDMNDETFGGSITEADRNFDFAGQTAGVADTLNEEQFTFARNKKTVDPTSISSGGNGQNSLPGQQSGSHSLQPLASLWGPPVPAQQQAPTQQPRILSLEEVEAQMLAGNQSQPLHHQQVPPQAHPQYPGIPPFAGPPPPQFSSSFPPGNPYAMAFPQDPAIMNGMGIPPPPPGPPVPPPQQQQQQQQRQQVASAVSTPVTAVPTPSTDSAAKLEENASEEQTASLPYSIVQRQTAPPPSLDQLRNEAAAKTNATQDKPHQRARDVENNNNNSNNHSYNNNNNGGPGIRFNGLMTQWDKNFIMRVQLQQMVTEDPYNEDFYYQVHSAIQSRNNPQQPLNALAKTYLFQTGQRSGRYRRGHNDNPLKRMQQQVQQAVASAREHPKREKFQAEGALGSISVGSGKRPRKTLNLQLSLQEKENATSKTGLYAQDQRQLLRSIEEVYASLLDIESAERSRPEEPEALAEWESSRDEKVSQMWDRLQVLAPVDVEGNQPFILILAHDKGKKLIPRIFRHIDAKQRLTLLTRIVAHLDQVDVVKYGSYTDGELKTKSRESIELFSQTVLPPLVHLISESSYEVVIGLLDIMLNSSEIVHLSSTKAGLAFLTVLISRAELINQEDNVEQADVENWQNTFNNLFTKVRGHLLNMFPARNVDDSYVWHFLASLAVAARLEHQRVLVDEVREKIFGTMNEAKALPIEIATAKISNLNLFLNVMGLNATTTEITELN